MPWDIIQHFAIKAGAHIYSKEGDVVYANQSYLSVSASKPGRREIRMPGKYALKELLGAGSEFKPDNKFEIDFTAESCRCFQVSAG